MQRHLLWYFTREGKQHGLRSREMITQAAEVMYRLLGWFCLYTQNNHPNMKFGAALDGAYNKRPKYNTRYTSREFPLNTHVNAETAPCS